MIDYFPNEYVEINGEIYIRYAEANADGSFAGYRYFKEDGVPTPPPTPINKATLLTDFAAAAYGLSGDDATPSGVFEKTPTLLKLSSYITPGTYTWVAPDFYGNGSPYYVYSHIIGGGGSGGSGYYGDLGTYAYSFSGIAQGGASGCMKIRKFRVIPGQSYQVVVGAGGVKVTTTTVAPGSGQTLSGSGTKGKNGSSSSFNGESANGGDGGGYNMALWQTSAARYFAYAVSGGCLPIQVDTSTNVIRSISTGNAAAYAEWKTVYPYITQRAVLGATVPMDINSNPSTTDSSYDWINKIRRLSAGGSALIDTGSVAALQSTRVLMDDGLYNSAAAGGYTQNTSYAAIDPTSPGCGGGGALRTYTGGSPSAGATIISANGAPGMVEIYLGGKAA